MKLKVDRKVVLFQGASFCSASKTRLRGESEAAEGVTEWPDEPTSGQHQGADGDGRSSGEDGDEWTSLYVSGTKEEQR